MGLMIGAALGVMLGIGVVRIHRFVDGGVIVGALAGGLGGWLGARWFGPDLAAALAHSDPAGAAAAGALGGMALALVAGIVTVQVRNRLHATR